MQRSLLLAAALAGVASGLRIIKGAPASPRVSDEFGYYWPSSRGHVFAQGQTAFVGPKLGGSAEPPNGTSLLWSFAPPKGDYHSIPIGMTVDGNRSVYAVMDNIIHKLDKDMNRLWSWLPENEDNFVVSTGALYDGRLHFTTSNGRVYALNVVTGRPVWMNKIADKMNITERGFVAVHDGLVVAAVNSTENQPADEDHGGNGLVGAFESQTGKLRWITKPFAPLSTFQASFPGDGSVVFQDREGTVYSHNMSTGEMRWVGLGEPGTYTRGFATVSDGVVFSVTSNTSSPPGFQDDNDESSPGWLTARLASNGQELWRKRLVMPPENGPVVGRLPGRSDPSVVQPCGYSGEGSSSAIYAFDALTGQEQWTFQGPKQEDQWQAGVEDGIFMRFTGHTSQPELVTPPWSAPLIDARGTVYVGSQNGYLYALRDDDMDGKVEGSEEVTYTNTHATTLGTSSPAIVPGMCLIAHANNVFAIGLPDQVPLSA